MRARWLAVVLVVGVACAVAFLCRKALLDAATGTVTGLYCPGEQLRDMGSAHPRLRKRVEPVIKALRSEGYDFQITSVYRSPERQQCLYDISRLVQRHTGRNGFTKTRNSRHNHRRHDKPASLAVDLHIYGESVHKTVQFYKRLRDLSVKAGLRSGGNFKKTNPHWKQFGLGWDPGHVYLRR